MTTPDWRQQFGYDRYGNRSMGTGSTQTFGRNSTETQALIGPDPAVSTSTNRITNRTGELYEFDASGNMTKDALGNRSVYDIENHQTEYFYAANTGTTPDAKYYYDGDGKRVKKVVGTETTIFIYNAGGNLAAEYTLGVTVNPSPQTNYLTTDTLGSTRVVTNGVGQVVARHDYLPFGDEIYGLGGRTSAQGFAQPDTTRQRFTGYEHDTETGLDFAQARYYGNGLGRFTGVDPVMDSAKPSTPQSWNRFIYCVNNPTRYVDPSGLSWAVRHVEENGQRSAQFLWYADKLTPEQIAQGYSPYSYNWFFGSKGALHLGTHGPEDYYFVNAEFFDQAGYSYNNYRGITNDNMSDYDRLGLVAATSALAPKNSVNSFWREVVDTWAYSFSFGGASGGRSGAARGARRTESLVAEEGPVRYSSKYSDGTLVPEGTKPPRLSNSDPLVSQADGPFSLIRWDTPRNRIYQIRTFNGAGHPVLDLDITRPTFPNGTMRPNHNFFEIHPWRFNQPAVGPRGGFHRHEAWTP